MHPTNSQLCVSTIVRHSAAATLKFIFEFVCVLVAQSCLTLCNPIGYSLPGSSIHGISQARILEWVAFLSPGDLPDSGIKTTFLALAGRFFTVEPPGKPLENSTELCMRKFSSQTHQVDHDPASPLGRSDSKIRICPGI